ncbi:hypothetical protein ACP70R_027143 [Stipagrostis hirtigluma subsp. patula]
MKQQRHLAMAKLSNAARDFLVSMPRRKLPALGIGSAVVAKFRELWEGLTRGGGVPRPADDYFRWSYEFSCTATPVVPVNGHGRGRRRRWRLPPCVGGKQARQMLASVTPRDERWSPEAGPERSPVGGAFHEIDGLAEAFINRFHEQLRMQSAAELQADPAPVT